MGEGGGGRGIGGLRGTHEKPGTAGSDPSRAGQVGRASSVSGEVLHLPNLHPGETSGGQGDQQVFPRQGLSRLADVALLLQQTDAFQGREGLLSAAVRARTEFPDLGCRGNVVRPPQRPGPNPSPQLQPHLGFSPSSKPNPRSSCSFTPEPGLLAPTPAFAPRLSLNSESRISVPTPSLISKPKSCPSSKS